MTVDGDDDDGNGDDNDGSTTSTSAGRILIYKYIYKTHRMCRMYEYMNIYI